MKTSRWIIGLLLLGLLCTLIIIGHDKLEIYLSSWAEQTRPELNTADWLAVLVFSAALSAMGLPRQAIALGFGHMLGGAPAAALATTAAVMGCTIDFAIARRWLRPWLQGRFLNRLTQLDGLLQQAPFLKALALRLFPSGSNLLTSLLGGASSVRAPAFIAGSAIGYLPQMVLFAYLGAGASWAIEHGDNLSVALLAATLILALSIYLHHRSKH